MAAPAAADEAESSEDELEPRTTVQMVIEACYRSALASLQRQEAAWLTHTEGLEEAIANKDGEVHFLNAILANEQQEKEAIRQSAAQERDEARAVAEQHQQDSQRAETEQARLKAQLEATTAQAETELARLKENMEAERAEAEARLKENMEAQRVEAEARLKRHMEAARAEVANLEADSQATKTELAQLRDSLEAKQPWSWKPVTQQEFARAVAGGWGPKPTSSSGAQEHLASQMTDDTVHLSEMEEIDCMVCEPKELEEVHDGHVQRRRGAEVPQHYD
eukprot:TRINITY_DN6270_c0_g1_i10.p1 TRINITY_DN6270_c0_g1~~TRINITY_DN6270_c0_g1_i10.p1  ORF type:complete len:305 (+),score=74.92 TRINITY_DN6270_c0_g1_i10:81-917(+)